MSRWLAAFVTVALAITFFAGKAGAAALTPSEHEELRATLAEAQEVQRICYSYHLHVTDDGGSEDTVETGASWLKQYTAGQAQLGAGPPMTFCNKAIQVSASVVYTSSTSEAEDWGTYVVEVMDFSARRSDPGSAATLSDRLNDRRSTLLSDPGEDLFNAMVSLPGLAASLGLGPYLPLEVRTDPAAADETLTDDPGSDFWRTKGVLVAVLAAGLVTAIVCMAYTWFTRSNETWQDE